MSERVLVTGATSAVGRELVRLLLAADREVRAGTRRPDRAGALFDGRVEVVELDYRQPATFDAAVEWVDRVFLQPPAFDPDAHDTLKPFLDWSVQAGARHVVTLSAMGVEVREDLPIRRVERHVASLGIDYTWLRPNFYMQTLAEGFLGERIRRTGSFAMPVAGARVSLVDASDVAGVAAAALTSGDHVGAAYTLTGPEALAHEEMAAIMSEAAGREIAFSSCTDEEMLGWLVGAGWPEDVAGVVIALYQSVRGGVRAAVADDVARVLGRPPRGFAAFAQEHAAAWKA